MLFQTLVDSIKGVSNTKRTMAYSGFDPDNSIREANQYETYVEVFEINGTKVYTIKGTGTPKISPHSDWVGSRMVAIPKNSTNNLEKLLIGITIESKAFDHANLIVLVIQKYLSGSVSIETHLYR